MLFEENIVLALEKILPDVLFIFAYRNHTEPQDPYCLIQQVSIYPTAQAERNTSVNKDSKPIEVVSQPTNCLFNLSFYCQSNSTLQEIARKFQMGLQSNYFQFAFSEQNLSLVNLTKIMYTSESINSTTEIKRATLQLTVSGIVYEEWEINDIKQVGVIGTNKEDYVFLDNNYDTEGRKWLK